MSYNIGSSITFVLYQRCKRELRQDPLGNRRVSFNFGTDLGPSITVFLNVEKNGRKDEKEEEEEEEEKRKKMKKKITVVGGH